jgi:Uri superfamily endonuclease
MRDDPGVYALVMQLDSERAIAIDKKGTQETFPRGWYVYVGSARGPGGLKHRTNRHRKRRESGKRMHWNVDYFREFAPIREVWFSHTESQRWEHDWAQAILKMHEASTPVVGFGASDCKWGCDSHFFHFPNRPFTVGFRSKLGERFSSHPEVFVDFVGNGAPLTEENGQPLLDQFERGHRFLERRRQAMKQGDLAEDAWTSLARGRPARKLIEKIAVELDTTCETLRADAEFSEAVETVVNNCGEEAFQMMFDPHRPQKRQAIMQLSRTADTRQRHRVEGVLEGPFRSVAPQNDDPVFDTVAFKEVPSRLSRARGSLKKCRKLLATCGEKAVLEDTRRIVDVCRRAAKKLSAFVRNAESKQAVVPKKLDREVVERVIARCNASGDEIGRSKSALKLTIKSVWDFPEMQRRGLLPTEKEREKTLIEIETIIATANEILSKEERS